MKDYVGEGRRGDEPGVGYRILAALDRVRRRGEEEGKGLEVRRNGGGSRESGMRKEGGEGGRKRESEREKWARRFYTP